MQSVAASRLSLKLRLAAKTRKLIINVLFNLQVKQAHLEIILSHVRTEFAKLFLGHWRILLAAKLDGSFISVKVEIR